jgi:hypothetical protein
MDGTKTIVIAIWFIAGVVGAILGAMLGLVGTTYLDRKSGT